MFTIEDHEFMAVAHKLAARGRYTTHPNPRVGCVIVNRGQIVGQGFHERVGGPHAEVMALKDATGNTHGASAYVTLEPCSHHGRTPPCVNALIEAGIARVVVAVQDPNPQVFGAGIAALQQAGIDVVVGLMPEQTITENCGFFQRMSKQRPFVRIKLAMSLDGRTALRSGQSKWITGESARLDVQRWRARSSAIMVGINTILADDPSLTVRMESLLSAEELEFFQPVGIRQPLRIILDSRLRMPADTKLLKLPGDVLIVTTADDSAKAAELISSSVEVIRLQPDQQGRPTLSDMMSVLAAAEINEVLVESGPSLAGALMREQLVDQLIIYMAPSLLGDAAAGLFSLPLIANMNDKVDLAFDEVRQIGSDLRIIANPIY